jgi:hypothetical protein
LICTSALIFSNIEKNRGLRIKSEPTFIIGLLASTVCAIAILCKDIKGVTFALVLVAAVISFMAELSKMDQTNIRKTTDALSACWAVGMGKLCACSVLAVIQYFNFWFESSAAEISLSFAGGLLDGLALFLFVRNN